MARITLFERSNRAHIRLNRKYISAANTARNRAYGNYHAECLEIQRRTGKIIPKAERKKMFTNWCRYEGYKKY